MKEKKQKKGIAKRLFSAFLVLALVVTMLPTGTTKVQAEDTTNPDVTWTSSSFTGRNTDILEDTPVTVSGIKMVSKCTRIIVESKYVNISLETSGDGKLTFSDTNGRKIKKIIFTEVPYSYMYESTYTADSGTWTYTKEDDAKTGEFTWEGTEAADAVSLISKPGAGFYCETVQFYLEDTRTTPTASDLTYDSSTGIVSAAEGKNLGTVTTYYKVNGAWTTTQPTTAGTYDVGAVTAGSNTYKAAGSADEPLTDSWTYVVKAAPTASDLTYDSSTGIVSAAEDKNLGTVTTYYKVNGEWTTTRPTTVGTYEVGAVTEGSNTYKAAGSAEKPLTTSWTYVVKETPDVTWNTSDIMTTYNASDNNPPTVNGIQLCGGGGSYVSRDFGCFYVWIGDSDSSGIVFKDQQEREIKKIIIYKYDGWVSFVPDGWSVDGNKYIWEGEESADSVTLRTEAGAGFKSFRATKVEFYLGDKKATPTASDLTYDSSTGIVSAAEGKELGTVTTYYKVNGEWTTTKPTTAGTYEVGAVTAGSETYKAAGSADEPLTASWTYVVKAAGGDDDSSGSDKNDASGKVSVTTDKQAGNFAAGGLVSTADELKKAVLTDSDKAAMADGKNINIWLEMKDQSTTVSDSDKAAITATLPSDCEVGIYLDINLWKQIEGNEEAKVTETNGTVKIAFTIPESLQKTDRVYQIIRLHNGEVEALDTIVDENYGLTFETIGFSTYALVYRDKVSAAEKDTTTTTTTTTTTDTTTTAAATDTTAVKTGDNTNVVPYILLIMFVFVGFAGVYARRKRL